MEILLYKEKEGQETFESLLKVGNFAEQSNIECQETFERLLKVGNIAELKN